MSAPHKTWTQVETRVKQRIASRKLRHARFWKLQGNEAKKAVIEGVVARLMAPDAVFPYALRKRLAPRPLVAKGVPAGWLGSWRPVNSTVWKAWLIVHERYIENGTFWFEESAAHDELIDRAIDAERISYCKDTADCGGPKGGKLDPELSELVSRFSETGQAYAREPSRAIEIERQQQLEKAALEARAQVEAEENEKLRQAINAAPWARKLPLKQREALNLILFEPALRGCDIAVRCGVAESTVSKRRAQVEELADKILTIPEEFARSVTEEEVRAFFDANRDRIRHPYEDVAEKIREYLSRQDNLAPDAAPDETLDETLTADEPGALDATEVEVDKKGDIAELNGELSLAPLQGGAGVPDVDSDCPESVARSYARSRIAERAMNGDSGRRKYKYSDKLLVTGTSKPSAKDYAEMAKRTGVERVNSSKRFADTAARHLRQKARDSGHDIDGALQIFDTQIAQKKAEVAALKAVRRVEVLRIANLPELAWIESWCRERKVSADDLLGETIVPKT